MRAAQTVSGLWRRGRNRRAAFALSGLLGGVMLCAAVNPAMADGNVQFTPQPDGSVQVTMDGTAPTSITPDRGGLRIVFAGHVGIDLAGLHHIPGLETTRLRSDDEKTVLILRGSQGRVSAKRTGDHLVLTASKLAAQAGKTSHAAAGDPSPDELNTLRKNLASKLALMNADSAGQPAVHLGNTPGQQDNAVKADAKSDSSSAGTGTNNPDIANTPPAQPQSGSSFANSDSTIPPAARLPACKEISLQPWPGKLPYPELYVQLRGKLARAPDKLDALADLAEFYVAHWQPQEALALLAGWSDDDPTAPGRDRLLRVRDIARLMRHEPIQANSTLLAAQPGCESPTEAIWKAMQAAATSDTPQVIANAKRAREELDDIPEPMKTGFALTIADGSHQDPKTLALMVSALRDSAGGTITDVNGRWLLLAEQAAADHNSVDEEMFLEHAAENTYNVPGLIASVRLAGTKIRRADQDGAQADKFLQDIARTYRRDALGQEAALVLARQRLAAGNFAAAFELADESAQADRNPGESAAAEFCNDLLRKMLVNPEKKPVPPAQERMSLYWRYEGYATPGTPGDDIRVAAAKLLMQQHFADSALDVTRQFSPDTMKDPANLLLRARTEALAQTGDASAAIAMAQSQPVSDDTNTIIANALARQGRLPEAARKAAEINTTAGHQLRADLLYQANNWADAASAYAALLHDADLDQPERLEATRRYALSTSLAQQPTSGAPIKSLMVNDKLSDHLQSIGLPNQSEEPPVTEIRAALQRAKKIETILAP